MPSPRGVLGLGVVRGSGTGKTELTGALCAALVRTPEHGEVRVNEKVTLSR